MSKMQCHTMQMELTGYSNLIAVLIKVMAIAMGGGAVMGMGMGRGIVMSYRLDR